MSDHTLSSAREVSGWGVSRRRILQGMAGLAAAGAARGQAGTATSKTVYISFLLHGNMCYDRYTKQEIRDKFPRIYATGVRALQRHPEVTAHIDFPGLTLLSLKHHAPWFLDELRPLVERRQVTMVGCQYAASQAMCADEEGDLVASRLSMEMLRRELQPDCSTFFPQEMSFHPQMPYIMNQIGARSLIVMPDGWDRPRIVTGMDGSSVNVFPLDLRTVQQGDLEKYYDTHADGSFVMGGGDFEGLSDVDAYVDEIAKLREKGKIVRWTTIERYEKEVGVHVRMQAPHPFAQAEEDRESSPSFSRWVSHPEDRVWHGHAVQALDAIRSAGFAQLATRIHSLGSIDPPVGKAWTSLPENPWDAKFESVDEYPETEAQYLTADGVPTVMSRAWHHLLIGLNSDASGWFPWMPRTRHRTLVLDSSRAFSNEALERFALQVASRLHRPAAGAAEYLLALNPGPARTAEVSVDVERPLALSGADGGSLPGSVFLRDGKWTASARVELPAYGYRLLGLKEGGAIERLAWRPGDAISSGTLQASLKGGRLSVSDGQKAVALALAPFLLQDPSGVAPAENVKPNWDAAATRVRDTALGPDLEIFSELAYAVWIRLVIGLRADRATVSAEVHVDMPRRFGKLGYDPAGLLLEFRGKAGRAFYDVPYATIEHTNAAPSFVAVQRFAALDAGADSFAVVTLGGAQSFQLSPATGVVATGLGASVQGRADTRPECRILDSGYAKHSIVSHGDPFLGSFDHQFALLFAAPAEVSQRAHELRTGVPVFRVNPSGGNWPERKSLLNVDAPGVYVTAFRTGRGGDGVVVNDVTGRPSGVRLNGVATELPAFGIRTLPVKA